jgi:ubiquinone/menaquinone biosynthesis C-methylase UbiE
MTNERETFGGIPIFKAPADLIEGAANGDPAASAELLKIKDKGTPIDAATEVPAATAFTHWGTCPEPAMATFVMRRFGGVVRFQTVPLSATREPSAKIKILDIGCGAGAQTLWLAAEGFEVTGIDTSHDAVRQARKRAHALGLNAPTATASIDEKNIFSEGAFDAAVDVCALQHLDHDQVRKALAEIYRVLKPGGWLFSMTANNKHDEAAFGGHFARCEDWFGVNRLYELPGFMVRSVREQYHTYTGHAVAHWIVEAQKP